MLRLTILVALVTSCLANSAFEFVNNCAYTVWVGILGTTNPAGGGFQLNSRSSRTVGVDDHWRGRMWGRTFCDNSGHCQTGDCGNRIQCNGAGGVPPATLAEFTLKGHAGLDFYDVSLVDGYNLMMKVTPKAGTYDPNGGGGAYYCQQAGCQTDINENCPGDLQVWYSGRVVACKSACLAHNRDDYCCRGAHNTPQTCPPFYSSLSFKRACPKAYSYAYDDQTSTFTCRGHPSTHYTIQFC